MTDFLNNDVATVADFENYTAAIKSIRGYREPVGFGIFQAQYGQVHTDKIINGHYEVPNWNNNKKSADAFQHKAGLVGNPEHDGKSEVVLPLSYEMVLALSQVYTPFTAAAVGSKHRNVQLIEHLKAKGNTDGYFMTVIYEDAPIQSLPAAYLKLYSMSHRLGKPREMNFDGMFPILPNVQWKGNKAYELELLNQRMELDFDAGSPHSQDKIPWLLGRVPLDPSIRIASAHSARLGAYLSPKTTIMPGAAYVNFNAGTIEARNPDDPETKEGFMVEGRISSKATIGSGTDVGGGASTMGVLSGGNSKPVIIGERCQLGANSTTGISLGDACVVDAGIAVLAGTKFHIPADDVEALAKINPGTAIDAYWGEINSSPHRSNNRDWKGSELAGLTGMHFRQTSTNGQMIVRRSTFKVVLNDQLHGTPVPH